MNRSNFLEYKHINHDLTSGIFYPRGTSLISILNEEGAAGWTVCGMISHDDQPNHTAVYFYRKVVIEEQS